jgi:hypothetical protein
MEITNYEEPGEDSLFFKQEGKKAPKTVDGGWFIVYKAA